MRLDGAPVRRGEMWGDMGRYGESCALMARLFAAAGVEWGCPPWQGGGAGRKEEGDAGRQGQTGRRRGDGAPLAEAGGH